MRKAFEIGDLMGGIAPTLGASDVPMDGFTSPYGAAPVAGPLGTPFKPVKAFKKLTMAEMAGMSHKQRIAALIQTQKSEDDARTNSYASDLVAKHLEEEKLQVADSEARLSRARAIMDGVAPEEHDAKIRMTEAITAALGGIASGDFEQANRAMLNASMVRAQKENARRQLEYETQQRAAEFDAKIALQDRGNSMSRVQDLQDQATSMQDNRERIEIQRRENESERAYNDRKEKTNDYNSLITKFKGVDDPAQVRLLAGEINRLSSELGIPGVDENEIKSMEGFATAKATDRKTKDGWAAYRSLVNSFGNMVLGYGGTVPPEVHAQFANAVSAIEAEFGIDTRGGVANPSGPTLNRQNIEADNQLDREKFGLEKLKFDESKKQSAIKNDIAWQELRLKQAKGEEVPKGDFDKAITSLRGKQRAGIAKRDAAKKALREYMQASGENVDPKTEAKYRDEIKAAQQTLSELEIEIQLLNDERSNVGGVAPASPFAGTNLQGFQGDIGANRPMPKPQPKPAAKAPAKPAPKPAAKPKPSNKPKFGPPNPLYKIER